MIIGDKWGKMAGNGGEKSPFIAVSPNLSPIITSYCRLGGSRFQPPFAPFRDDDLGVPAKMEPELKKITIFNKAQIGLLLIL